MTSREKILHAVEDLPADATYEDAMECLLLLRKVERGLQQANEGKTVSHEEAQNRMAKWLK
jgi:predicted transcriptional regulator